MANIILIRIFEILLAPYYDKTILWLIAPLIFALIMLQMYFGKYKTEQLGWNTAFGNTVSLMWITMILVRYSHEKYGILNLIKHQELIGYFILIMILGLLTITLTILNFQHILPKKFAFLISSSLPINGVAYFITIIVMGKIDLGWATLLAVIILFSFFALIFKVYRMIITPPKSEIPILKKKKEEKRKKERKIVNKIEKAIKKEVEKPIILISKEEKKVLKHLSKKHIKKNH